MSLTPFADDQGNLSLYAGMEMAALNNALYSNKPDYVRTVAAAAGGEVVEVVSNPAPADLGSGGDNRPCYTCWTQGDEFWFLIQGTYTVRQWLENAAGFFNTSGLGSSNQTFHGAWASMATKLLADFRAKVADNDTRPVNISGHSLGAAVAWDLAALFKQTFPGRVVRVMALASPRPMRGDYSGTMPTKSFDLQLEGDVVTYLPPNLPLQIGADWKQQGVKTIVSSGGEILAPTANDGELKLSLFTEGSLSTHFPGTYVDALLAHYKALPASAVTDAVLAAASITGSPSIAGRGSNGGGLVGVFKRAVFQFRDPSRRTWTEVVYAQNTAAELTDVRTKAEALLKLRVKMFGIGPVIINAYVSDDEFARDALYCARPKPEVSDGTWNKALLQGTQNQDDSDYAWTSLMVRMTSGTRSTKPSYLGGIPDFVSVNGDQGIILNGPMTKAYDNWVKELKANWGWKGINISPTDLPLKTVKGVTVANGKYTYTTDGDHGLNVGNWVTVAKIKGQLGNANGVQLVDAVPTTSTFIGSKVADADYRYLIGGVVQKRDYKVYKIDEVNVRGISEKKRGGSVGLPRGRQRKKR